MDSDTYKALLEEQKEHLLRNIAYLKEEQDSASTEGEVDDLEDLAALLTDGNDRNAIIKQQEKELQEVNHALEKIRQGTYGACEACGHAINPKRLAIEPVARKCVQCVEE